MYARLAHGIAMERCSREYPIGHDDLAMSWVDFGRIRRAQGEFEGARGFFRQALESYAARDVAQHPGGQLSIALALAEMGRTWAEEGDLTAALAYHEQSLEARRRLFPAGDYPAGHPSLANSLRDTGITCLLAGDHRRAFELLAESVRIEHSIAESFSGGASEAQLLNLAARRFQSLGPLLRAWEQSGRPVADAYAYVWNRHGLVPRLIAQRQRSLHQWAREGDSPRFDEYLHARQELARALLVSANDDRERHAARVTQIQQLNRTKEELEQQLTAAFELANSPRSAAAAVEALARTLPEHGALVDFYAHASWPFDATLPSRVSQGGVDRLVAFVVTRDQPVAYVPLPDPRQITSLVDAWHEEIMRDAPPVAGTALRETLWDPIAAMLPPDIQTVYVAPDGPVARIAWSALPCPGEIGVLLERYAFATVPHGSFLLDQLESPSAQPMDLTPALVVGDVDYGEQDGGTASEDHGLKQLHWPRLTASRREVEAIAVALAGQETTVLTGAEASARAVMQGLSRARLVHLATHGYFLDDALADALRLAAADHPTQSLRFNPSRASLLARSPFLRSGLALAGANRPATPDADGLAGSAEGILTADAVASLDAPQLSLVVLSACDTTRGDLAAGDGALGLQCAFHIAGARNVITGLWKIPDEAAADLMVEFYRQLAQSGASPLAALRSVQLDLARQARAASGLDRGINLAATVPWEAAAVERPTESSCGARNWAGFTLSGPGF